MNITSLPWLIGSSLAATILLTACNEQALPEKPIRPVLTQTVRIAPYWQQHNYSGEIRARYETNLGFRIGGKIVQREVEVGDRVAAGQVLARLDPADYRLRLLEAQAALAVARAEEDKARKDLDRYSSLLERKLISESDFHNFSNAFDVALARRKQAEAAVSVARNQADYTTLKADRDGIVTEVEAEEGQVVAAGQTVIRVALCCEKEAVVSVPENRLDDVRMADRVTATLWAVPGASYPGKVREISPGADPVTRTYRVRISLPEADQRVQYGMTVLAKVQRRLHGEVARLPSSALFQKGNRPAVWILDRDSLTVFLQPVEVAEYRQDGVLVKRGLRDGQYLVTAGVNQLVPGQRVRLLPREHLDSKRAPGLADQSQDQP